MVLHKIPVLHKSPEEMLWRPVTAAGVMHSLCQHLAGPVLGVQVGSGGGGGGVGSTPSPTVALGCSWGWGLEMEKQVCGDCPAWNRSGFGMRTSEMSLMVFLFDGPSKQDYQGFLGAGIRWGWGAPSRNLPRTAAARWRRLFSTLAFHEHHEHTV